MLSFFGTQTELVTLVFSGLCFAFWSIVGHLDETQITTVIPPVQQQKGAHKVLNQAKTAVPGNSSLPNFIPIAILSPDVPKGASNNSRPN
jgi:hypothetical protein